MSRFFAIKNWSRKTSWCWQSVGIFAWRICHRRTVEKEILQELDGEEVPRNDNLKILCSRFANLLQQEGYNVEALKFSVRNFPPQNLIEIGLTENEQLEELAQARRRAVEAARDRLEQAELRGDQEGIWACEDMLNVLSFYWDWGVILAELYSTLLLVVSLVSWMTADMHTAKVRLRLVYEIIYLHWLFSMISVIDTNAGYRNSYIGVYTCWNLPGGQWCIDYTSFTLQHSLCMYFFRLDR